MSKESRQNCRENKIVRTTAATKGAMCSQLKGRRTRHDVPNREWKSIDEITPWYRDFPAAGAALIKS